MNNKIMDGTLIEIGELIFSNSCPCCGISETISVYHNNDYNIYFLKGKLYNTENLIKEVKESYSSSTFRLKFEHYENYQILECELL